MQFHIAFYKENLKLLQSLEAQVRRKFIIHPYQIVQLPVLGQECHAGRLLERMEEDGLWPIGLLGGLLKVLFTTNSI